MKTLRPLKTILMSTLLTTATLMGHAALAEGGSSTGGGDAYVRDFVATATQEVYPWLLEQGISLKPKIDAETFLRAVNPRDMQSADHVYEKCNPTAKAANEREVQVCYSQENDRYYISRTMYPLDVKSSAKRALVAHELFRKMKIEGDLYEISRQMPIENQEADHKKITDIQCSIEHSQFKTEKILQDSSEDSYGKFETFKISNDQNLLLACGSYSKLDLQCTVIIEKKSAEKKVFAFSGFGRIGGIINGDTFVGCTSNQMLRNLINSLNKNDAGDAKLANVSRILSKDELNFCQGLQDFGSSKLIDQRSLCAPYLKTLSRALTKNELDYCKTQYSVQGFGSDNRLLCTKEVIGD